MNRPIQSTLYTGDNEMKKEFIKSLPRRIKFLWWWRHHHGESLGTLLELAKIILDPKNAEKDLIVALFNAGDIANAVQAMNYVWGKQLSIFDIWFRKQDESAKGR
jgi:hypothetical protein